jgi:hypothetical protein
VNIFFDDLLRFIIYLESLTVFDVNFNVVLEALGLDCTKIRYLPFPLPFSFDPLHFVYSLHSENEKGKYMYVQIVAYGLLAFLNTMKDSELTRAYEFITNSDESGTR